MRWKKDFSFLFPPRTNQPQPHIRKRSFRRCLKATSTPFRPLKKIELVSSRSENKTGSGIRGNKNDGRRWGRRRVWRRCPVFQNWERWEDQKKLLIWKRKKSCFSLHNTSRVGSSQVCVCQTRNFSQKAGFSPSNLWPARRIEYRLAQLNSWFFFSPIFVTWPS